MNRERMILPVIVVVLTALPLVGVFIAGKPVVRYLEFPPTTRYVEHEAFSWPVFIGLALLIVTLVVPIIFRVIASGRWLSAPRPSSGLTLSNVEGSAISHQPLQKGVTGHAPRLTTLPWWGWAGLGLTTLSWFLAWTRFPWMTPLQAHTFTPLWLGYILVVNGWTFARMGRCMMLHRPRYFLSLFPLSAVFWWFFEYLNRFVQNWYYVGVATLSPLEYVLRGTIPFSTVLPAVIGTLELLTAFPRLSAGLDRYRPVRLAHPRLAGWIVLVLSSVGLIGLGLWPNYLFPLVWVAPLLVITSLQTLAGRPTILVPVVEGNWRLVWLQALAALICGFFWELWNWQSLAHWQYAVPFVQRFHLFEMPLLGYAGYLPFGLECLVVADLCLSRKFAGGVEYYRAPVERTESVTA